MMRLRLSRSLGCVMAELALVQILGGALRVGSGGEDGALVVAEHAEPGVDIGGVIVTHVRREGEIGREEGAAELGDLS